MTLTLRPTSTLELDLVAVTTLCSLGSTPPGVSTSSGSAIKIAAWPNSTKNPLASLNVERRSICPAKKTRFLTRHQQEAFNYVANILTIYCSRTSTTIRRRRGQRRWRRSRSNPLDEQTASPTWAHCPRTDPPNSASIPPIPTSALSTRTDCRTQPPTRPKPLRQRLVLVRLNDKEVNMDLDFRMIHARQVYASCSDSTIVDTLAIGNHF
jgi:hypothetical protein